MFRILSTFISKLKSKLGIESNKDRKDYYNTLAVTPPSSVFTEEQWQSIIGNKFPPTEFEVSSPFELEETSEGLIVDVPYEMNKYWNNSITLYYPDGSEVTYTEKDKSNK